VNPLIVLAFGAGLLTPISPCGLALLPAYLAAFLHHDTEQAPGPVLARLRRALAAAAAITAGFTATVTAIGAALAAGLGTLVDVIPWAAAVLGVVLAAAGAMMLLGRSIRLSARLRVLPRLPGIRPPAAGSGTAAGRWRLAGFGAGYAFAAASCTLAVLLSVASQALTAGALTTTIGVFAAYAAGSAVLLLGLATATAFAEGALSSVLGRLARHLPRISGALLAASGIYLITYWTPSLLRHGTTPGADPVSAISATASTWISAHQTPVTAGAALLVITAISGTLLAACRSRPGQPDPCCPPSDTPAGVAADPAGHAR
jgi:cytochrome c biogenesis protein CcdA